eukprot:GEMP01007683.1.p1 GENE.GEMP01007683.1~~GEMP01007683.1.p1  ORF type:complete len:801 (+),score=161.65 GEMP01007683.1:134-2536(+)
MLGETTSGDDVLIGRDAEVSKLMSYVCSEENRVLLVTCGRGNTLANYVFGMPRIQRKFIQFLATRNHPMIILEGELGIGKSALLRRVRALTETLFPTLKMYHHRHEDGHIRHLMRKMNAESVRKIDSSANDDELIMMPLVARVAKHAGVVILIDQHDEACDEAQRGGECRAPFWWIPTPLPAGVRCIAATTAKYAPYKMERARALMTRNKNVAKPKHVIIPLAPLRWSAAVCLASNLGVIQGDDDTMLPFPSAANPLWTTLAARLEDVEDALACSDLPTLVTHMIERVENKVGVIATRCVLSAIACTRKGIDVGVLESLVQQFGSGDDRNIDVGMMDDDEPPRIWQEMVRMLTPLLRVCEGTLSCSSVLADAVATRYLASIEDTDCWRARLAHCMLRSRDNREHIEASHHLFVLLQHATSADMKRQRSEQLLHSLTDDWVVFERFVHCKRRNLLQYCRHIDGGYAAVCDYLTEKYRYPEPATPLQAVAVHHSQKCILGSFFSLVGEFTRARKVLLSTLQTARQHFGATDRRVGIVALLVAENEVRYWDSRRDWANIKMLSTLLESAKAAVSILGTHPSRPSERMEYANALTEWANGCFKAACVCNGTEAYDYLSQADETVQEALRVMDGCPASRILGRALLVGGLSLLVRGHTQLGERRLYYRTSLHAAGEMFLKAQRMLVSACGEINESSIYVHSNLAELYLYHVGNLPATVRHFEECCTIARDFLGSDHPNSQRKLAEFAQFLDEIGFSEEAIMVRAGNLHSISRLRRHMEAMESDISLDQWLASFDSSETDTHNGGR